MEQKQETQKQEKDTVNDKWNYFYHLYALQDEGKDISSELTELCSDTCDMASKANSLPVYRSLADLHYFCTEHLLRKYSTAEKGTFPQPPRSLLSSKSR